MGSHAIGHCKHYAPTAPGGGFATVCEAGVRYADVRIRPPIPRVGGLPITTPCHYWAKGHGCCDKREYPTPKEMAADEAETDRFLECIDREECPECGADLERHSRTRGGGYQLSCPAGCDVHELPRGRGDVWGGHG